jgi:hypothetical protein
MKTVHKSSPLRKETTLEVLEGLMGDPEDEYPVHSRSDDGVYEGLLTALRKSTKKEEWGKPLSRQPNRLQ